MQITTQKKQKNSLGQFVDQNPVEAIRSIGGGTEWTNDFWEQLLGEKEKKQPQKSGELQEGQDLNLSIEPGIDYRREIIHGSEKIASEENQALIQQIEMIVLELKRLSASSKELEIEFKDVIVTQNVVKPGKYHQGFFEWMLIIIKTARLRIEDAGAWLSAMKGKKGKKQSQNYWERFKKEGTTFGLSNERVVSTQTG
ncbi:MAG: hypothetical protein HYV37_03780 [Candidatus Levyibacteriota bacterium]|nr:MAG: hypothetical protein HYV37_03780 [Candidatus Levybacteria bacterium]